MKHRFISNRLLLPVGVLLSLAKSEFWATLFGGMQTLRFPMAFLSGCAAVFVIAAAATVYFCHSMAGGMDMPGGWKMSMMWMPMPGYTWTGSAMIFLLMWLVMMVAMMLPSALPMLLNIRKSTGHFEILAVCAAAGFFFVWMIIGAVVYAAGVSYAIETMQMDWLSWITPLFSGGTLILCGIVQFTPWKLSKLRQCRAPDCGMLGDGGTVVGGWRYGLKQGMVCCLCCAGPMLALLVLGAMNLTVMVVIAGAIAAEKLLPWPEKIVRVFGVLALLAGLIVIVKSLFFSVPLPLI